MADFDIHVSPKAQKLAQLTLNTVTGLYEYPPGSNASPLTPVAYTALQDAVTSEVAATQAKYDTLKAAILSDMQATGGDVNAIVFDDNAHSIQIGIGFKECMDRLTRADTRSILREIAGAPPGNKPPFQDIFREKFATPQAKRRYEDKGPQAFAGLRTAGYQDPVGDVDIDDADGPDDALGTVFAAQPGMTLDDDHGKPDGPKMLTESMDALGDAGVTTLFIEHFWQEQQAELDEYLNSADDAPLPKALGEAVRKLEDGATFKGQFTKLLAAAKKKKIRIVGLDEFDAKTPDNQDPGRWEERAARFNESAAKVVQKEKGGGKFLLLAGGAHNNTHAGGIPGLAQLLGVPGFKVEGGQLAKSPEDKSQRGMRTDPAQAFFKAYCAAFHASQPDAQGEIAYADIERYVKSQLATLDQLTPASARKLGEAAAKRATEQMRADGASISTVSDEGVLEAAAVKGGSLLHVAADANDPALMQELMDAGQSPTATDPAGNTPLHALLKDSNKDVVAASKLLIDNGASLATTNAAGTTPLHQALASKRDTEPFNKWIDDHPADFKKAAAVKKGGLAPLDMIIARGDAAVEDKMYDDGMVDDDEILIDPNDPKSAPEILALATKCDDEAIRPNVLKHYEKLYKDYPEFRSTLDLAALSALGDRRNGKALRLLMVRGDTASKVTTGSGYGAYDDRNSSLALGVDRDEEELLGTLIHELTHHAADKIFSNDTMPFPVNDPGHVIEQAYLNGVTADVQKGVGAMTKSDAAMSGTVTGRVASYVGKTSGADARKRANQEYIAGVPQALVSHGRDAMERGGGGLLKFWDDQLRPSMENLVSNDPNRRKLNKSTGTGQPYKADKPWGGVNELDSSRVASSVMNKINIDHGIHADYVGASPGKIPPYQLEHYVLPQSYNRPPLVYTDTDDVQVLLTKLTTMKGDLSLSQPGWWDAVRVKVERALALPNPDRGALTALVDDINIDLKEGNKASTVFNQNRKEAEKAVKETFEALIKSGKLPKDVHAGVLQAFMDRAAALVGPGTVNPTQLKSALGKLAVEFVGDARTAASRKGDVDAQAEKRARHRHLITNGLPISPEEFAEAAVLEAEHRYALENPSPNGVPPEVGKSKQKELIAKLAQTLRGKPTQDFDKYVAFVKDNVLYTKSPKKTGKRDQSHQSMAKRKEWVRKLGQL